jgi:glucokinase
MARTDITLGVDVGGTNTVMGYVDSNGRVMAHASMPTNAHLPHTLFFERLHDRAVSLRESIDEKCRLVGIGIGAPNANYYRGTIEHPPNLAWDFVDVQEELKKYYSVPIAVTNDANAAAIGEMLFGAAKGMKDFIIITLGTGLGSGIVANGELIYGTTGFAGELGHTIVDPEGRDCGCGRKGCLETYASANGLRRTVFELLSARTDVSVLRESSFASLTAKQIGDAANNGDTIALEAFDRTGKYLGLKLADAVAHTEPQAIILFGGVANAGEHILKPTKHYLEEYLLNIFKNKVEVIPSALPRGHAPIYGASGLIWNELRKNKTRRVSFVT